MAIELTENLIALRSRHISIDDSSNLAFPTITNGVVGETNPFSWKSEDLRNMEAARIEVVSFSTATELRYRFDGYSAERGPFVRDLTARIAAYSNAADAFPDADAAGYLSLRSAGSSVLVTRWSNLLRLRLATNAGTAVVCITPLSVQL